MVKSRVIIRKKPKDKKSSSDSGGGGSLKTLSLEIGTKAYDYMIENNINDGLEDDFHKQERENFKNDRLNKYKNSFRSNNIGISDVVDENFEIEL